MPFRCRICLLVYRNNSQRTDCVSLMGILTYVCKECKRTGNTKQNTTHCAFCDEKHDDLEQYVEEEIRVLLCKRCLQEAIEQKDDPKYI